MAVTDATGIGEEGENSLAAELQRYDTQLRQQEEVIHRLRLEVKKLRGETIIDYRTNIFSCAYFYSRLREEIIRSERYRHFLSIILIHLNTVSVSTTSQIEKLIRDFGHMVEAGLARRTNVLAHYGKRQASVILPETDRSGASIVARRFDTMLTGSDIRIKYGIVSYPEDASNLEMVLSKLNQLSEELVGMKESQAAKIIRVDEGGGSVDLVNPTHHS